MENRKCSITVQLVAAYFNQDENVVRYGNPINLNLNIIHQLAIYLCKTHYKISDKTLVEFFKLKDEEVAKYIDCKIALFCEEGFPQIIESLKALNNLLAEIDPLLEDSANV